VVTDIKGEAVILRQLGGSTMYRGGHITDQAFQLEVTLEPEDAGMIADTSGTRTGPVMPVETALDRLRAFERFTEHLWHVEYEADDPMHPLPQGYSRCEITYRKMVLAAKDMRAMLTVSTPW
jgi:hypothetical protein